MRSLFFVFYFLFSLSIYAQNEGNIWYFGVNAGIDFNTGSPVAINNGQLITNEGCATMCNANGDLLFYTDGSVVYNANHVVMPNGTGLNGDASSTQSAIIVKKPGTTNIYTIFTVAAQGFTPGLQYSEVDMTLDGGLGDITAVSNVIVYTPTCEKITAISHQNGIDFWLVAKDYLTDDFRTFLYNASGLSTTWITSDGDFTPATTNESIGYLRTNASGSKIAMANWTANHAMLYDFNNSTGQITNPITLPINSAYGIEFSPNGQYLYVSQAGLGSSNVYQYDILAGDESDIINSEVIIGQTASVGGALQLAPDLKIYFTYHGASFLGTISDPNLQGTNCNFDLQGFPLSPGATAALGLPTFYNDILLPSTITSICIGDSVELEYPPFINYNWALESDPTTVISTDTTITVSPDTTTTYLVYEGVDTFRFEVIVNLELLLDLGPDICDAVDSVVLNVNQPGLAYLWQDGSDSSIFTATETGIYWVQITDSVCVSVDSIFIQFELTEIQGDDIVYCDSTVSLTVVDSNPEVGHWTYVAPPGGPQNVIFDPNTNVIDPFITVPELGEYNFMYTSVCGITDTHTVTFASQAPILNIALTQACDFNINLMALNPVQDGVWTATGPTGETITIDDVNNPTTTAVVSNYGEYTFTYTYDFCEASFSATIDVLSVKPQITNTQTQYICDKIIPLSAIVPGHIEQWSVVGPSIVTFDNFQSANTFATVTDYGDYTFFFSGCGGIDTFNVSFIKNAPTLNAPTYIHCGTEALVEVLYYEDNIGTWSYQAETNENITLEEIDDNTVSVTSDSYGSVDVTYTTCDTSTTVNITFMCELEIPNVFSPNNDGLNNEFFISRLNTKFYDRSKFVVYDRWGVEVYTNGRYGLEGSWWNGKTAKHGEDLPEGVYYYVLDLHNKINDLDETYKGSLHIFR